MLLPTLLQCSHVVLAGSSYLALSICFYCCITKTHLYNFNPLEPHFYIVKLGFTGVYISFLISAQKHRLWVLIRTTSSCFEQKYDKYQISFSENFHFLVVKFPVYLNRHVFVMFGVLHPFQHYLSHIEMKEVIIKCSVQ